MAKKSLDGKKRAANDVEDDTPKAAKAKVEKAEEPEERYQIGSVATVKRGFLLQLVQFVQKKGTISEKELVEQFSGRQIGGRPISQARVARYVRYCLNHGQFKVVKNGAK